MTRGDLIDEAERALRIAGKNLDNVCEAWLEIGGDISADAAVPIANAYATYAVACIDLARLK